MDKQTLVKQIFEKRSYLCVGLDTDVRKLPAALRGEKDPVFEFNRRIIEETAPYCVAYKPNIAFYEAMGPAGWESLQKTLEYIPATHFTIADAKRGDIGNTSGLYARTFFDKSAAGMSFDAVTVAPYMGADSVSPFLEFQGKWVIVLALTSNKGSNDFQRLQAGESSLYEVVLKTSCSWAGPDRMMFVAGATHPEEFAGIRRLVPEHFLLVPGVGAQGGDLEGVSRHGLTEEGGLLVNASRSIIYAGNGVDFATEAGKEALKLQKEMAIYLEKYPNSIPVN